MMLLSATTTYVPWNTNALGDFFSFIARAVGATLNVAVVPFLIILAILIAIRIVKMFARG